MWERDVNRGLRLELARSNQAVTLYPTSNQADSNSATLPGGTAAMRPARTFSTGRAGMAASAAAVTAIGKPYTLGHLARPTGRGRTGRMRRVSSDAEGMRMRFSEGDGAGGGGGGNSEFIINESSAESGSAEGGSAEGGANALIDAMSTVSDAAGREAAPTPKVTVMGEMAPGAGDGTGMTWKELDDKVGLHQMLNPAVCSQRTSVPIHTHRILLPGLATRFLTVCL